MSLTSVRLVIGVAVALAGALTAVVWYSFLAAEELKGSGSVVTEERPVSEFDRIYFRSAGTLRLIQGDTEALTIETDDNLMEMIETNVEDGQLNVRLWYKGGVATIVPTTLIYTVTLKRLRSVTLAATAELQGSHLTTDRLKVEATVSAKATLSDLMAEDLSVTGKNWSSVTVTGKVGRQSAVLYGSSKYHAAGLASDAASVEVHGTTQATVWVRDRLDATVADSGILTHIGKPTVLNSNVSGSGTIRQESQ